MTADDVIDKAALETIESLQQPGADNLLEKIVSLFLDESLRLSSRIGNAVRDSDSIEVAASAHSLKSSSANVGAVQVSEISKRLEAAGRSGDLRGGSSLHEELVAAIASAHVRLRNYLMP